MAALPPHNGHEILKIEKPDIRLPPSAGKLSQSDGGWNLGFKSRADILNNVIPEVGRDLSY